MSMQIAPLILLAVIAALLWKSVFGPRYLGANSNEWLVLEWHKLLHANDIGKRTWDGEAPVHIQFVPITGWKYSQHGYKHGESTPITPLAYGVQNRFDSESEYETISYWVRDGAICHLSGYLSRTGNFWVNLSNLVIAGTKIEVHGSVPDCCQKKFLEILAVKGSTARGGRYLRGIPIEGSDSVKIGPCK